MTIWSFHSIHCSMKILEMKRNEQKVHPSKMQNNLVSSYYLHFRNLKYAKKLGFSPIPTLDSSISSVCRSGCITVSANILTHFSTFPRSVSTMYIILSRPLRVIRFAPMSSKFLHPSQSNTEHTLPWSLLICSLST